MGEGSTTETRTALCGIKQIRDYCRSRELPSSEASVMAMILDAGMPARKLGGTWVSDRLEIDRWIRDYAAGRTPASADASPAAKPSVVEPAVEPSTEPTTESAAPRRARRTEKRS